MEATRPAEKMSHGEIIGHLYAKHGHHSGQVNGKKFSELVERHRELHSQPTPAYREEHDHGEG